MGRIASFSEFQKSQNPEISESIKNKLATGVICTILSTGAISCKKDRTGFGYNIGASSTEYSLSKGTPNKDITISRPSGETKHRVDSTLAQRSNVIVSGSYKFDRPITPTEAIILKAGAPIAREKQVNNNVNYDPDRAWDYDRGKIHVGGYDDEIVELDNCRQVPIWNLGIEELKKQGKDIDAMIRKADGEVSNGIYYTEGN